MDNKVAALAATADPGLAAQTHRVPPLELGAVRSVAAAQDTADLRLVIEESDIAGAYIYKTVDRRTGEVVSQFPREEVARMREEPDYEAGAVIRTQA